MNTDKTPRSPRPTAALSRLHAELRRLRSMRQRAQRTVVTLDAQIKLLAAQERLAARRALRRAVLLGDDQAVWSLMADHGRIDVNRPSKSGATFLFHAVHRDDNAEVIRLLLSAGANPNLGDDDGNTPLMVAVRPTQLQAVRMLVDAGAKLNVANNDGDTPLTNAAIWGATDIVQFLLDRGADPLMADGAGITAAELAQQRGLASATPTVQEQVAEEARA